MHSRLRIMPLVPLVWVCAHVTGPAAAQEGWSQRAKLTAPDGQAGDWFGRSVAVNGDTLLIGADGHDEERGAVYVFERVGRTWAYMAKLTAPDGNAGDGFGADISLSGDMALIGAWEDDDLGVFAGSAYVFEKAAGAWAYTAKLTAPDGQFGDAFGVSVALCGDAAAIGARSDDNRGSAYIFERIGGAWMMAAKLTAPDGSSHDWFGQTVDLNESTAVIGAEGDDLWTGSAYVFERSGGTWVFAAKLAAPNGAGGDEFGRAVAICGGEIMIGAPYESDGDLLGSVHFFERAAGAWTHKAKLVAPDDAPLNLFGHAISASPDTMVIGALNDADHLTGAAYVFNKVDGLWAYTIKLIAPDAGANDYFSASVAVNEGTVVSGAIGDDDRGQSAGSAYVYESAGCAPDANHDGAVDTRDVAFYLNLWTAGDFDADWNSDGAIDSSDVIGFLNEWTAAFNNGGHCP
ncbi:MAG TPA: FG-GAP repeat protein [Phycisphaerales bacterium]|nr:FG-GAP repeat protein [Phycisphaerales bacterium]